MATIRLLSVGSRGDLQPYLAILRELQRRGHAIELIGSVNFEAIATARHAICAAAWRLQATAGIEAGAGGNADNGRCGDGRHRARTAASSRPRLVMFMPQGIR